MFVNAGYLMKIAKDAYKRSMDNSSHDRASEVDDPLIAIIFSAASTEAFINEITVLAGQPPVIPAETGKESPEIENLASLLSKATESKQATDSRFLIAKRALTGKPFDRGSYPFQDFGSLLQLRNSILHLKQDRIQSAKKGDVQIDYPPIVGRLQSKNILASFAEDTIASWLLLVRTPKVAKWACNSASHIITDIVKSIPAGDFQRNVEEIYMSLHTFQIIE